MRTAESGDRIGGGSSSPRLVGGYHTQGRDSSVSIRRLQRPAGRGDARWLKFPSLLSIGQASGRDMYGTVGGEGPAERDGATRARVAGF